MRRVSSTRVGLRLRCSFRGGARVGVVAARLEGRCTGSSADPESAEIEGLAWRKTARFARRSRT